MSSAVNSVPYGQMSSALGWTHSAVSSNQFIYKPKQRFIQNWLLDELYGPDDYIPISLPELNNPFEYGVNGVDLKQKRQCTQQRGCPPNQSKEEHITQLISQPHIAKEQCAKPSHGRPKQKQEDKILQLKSQRGRPKKQKEDFDPQVSSQPYAKPRCGRPKKENKDQCIKQQPGHPKQNKENALIKTISPQKFQCDLCDKTTTTKGNLKKHMRVHTGEKPYSCQHCDRFLTSKLNLNKHMLARHVLKEHTDVKSIKSTRNSLKSGLTTTITKPFICHLCGGQFTSSDILSSHVTQCRLMIYGKLIN